MNNSDNSGNGKIKETNLISYQLLVKCRCQSNNNEVNEGRQIVSVPNFNIDQGSLIIMYTHLTLRHATMTIARQHFQHVVLDAGPLIHNSFPPTLADTFYTIPEVVSEIRDETTRHRLQNPPFILKIRSPSPRALQIVKDFAKVTGDAASLSSTDLKVVALSVALEMELNGDRSLVRLDPQTITAQTHHGQLPRTKKNETMAPKNDSNFDGGWITPENIAKKKAHDLSADNISQEIESLDKEAVSTASIACISTDYALQNLLLQMRLTLVAPDGYQIKQVKNWLLRCHACYWTTHQIDRRFCDRCGNPTLIRTSYMIDAQGMRHLFLKKNFQFNNRGTIAPIPPPRSQGGKVLLLREDQKEYQQAMRSFHRQEKKAERAAETTSWEELDDRLATAFGDLNIKKGLERRRNRVNLHDPALPVIGFGRRNPNTPRRKV